MFVDIRMSSNFLHFVIRVGVKVVTSVLPVAIGQCGERQSGVAACERLKSAAAAAGAAAAWLLLQRLLPSGLLPSGLLLFAGCRRGRVGESSSIRKRHPTSRDYKVTFYEIKN